MNRMTSLVGVAVLGIVAGSAAARAAQDVYFSLQNPPSEPITDNAGAVTWGSDWSLITLPWGWHFDVDQSLFLGLENRYAADQTKTVTLDYVSYIGGVGLTGQTLAGYPPNTQATKPWDSLTVSQIYLGHYEAVGTIFPQSSWEWIELFGHHKGDVGVVDYFSTCTPSPGVGVIFAAGGFGVFAVVRRR